MAITFSTAELLLLKQDVEDSIENMDEALKGEILGASIDDAESVTALVRTCRVTMLHKIDQELAVPFREAVLVS